MAPGTDAEKNGKIDEFLALNHLSKSFNELQEDVSSMRKIVQEGESRPLKLFVDAASATGSSASLTPIAEAAIKSIHERIDKMAVYCAEHEVELKVPTKDDIRNDLISCFIYVAA